MLSQYIKKENCHDCRFCCRFRNSNLWDVPLFTYEDKSKLEEKYTFKKVNSLWTPMLIKENDFFVCPFLHHDSGCILGKRKPFDCAIWPFYVMNKDGKIVLAQCSDCEIINNINEDKLISLLYMYFAQIKDYINKYPDYVKPHIPSYKILLYL